MRVVRVGDEPPYGVGLGSILVSLLEPAPGQARAFHRWYERDHFYAGCMTGPHFFAGRRFVATRELRALRESAPTSFVEHPEQGSCLALYWIERGHHEQAEQWALERVLWLAENGRMAGGGERRVVHAGFHMQRWAACRDDDGVPPELALDHPFPGVVLMLGQRPPDVSLEARDAWLLERELPRRLPGSGVALCLSLSPRALPESSPAWTPLPEGWERRTLEVFFLDRDPRTAWSTFFPSLCAGLREARMGDVALAAAFVPTIPGTDRYVDEL